MQTGRFAKLPEGRRPRANAELDGEALEAPAAPEPVGRSPLTAAAERLRH